MKKIFLCLAALLLLAAMPAQASAEGLVLKYHVKVDATMTALAAVQAQGRPAMLEVSKSLVEKDYDVTLMPQHLSLRAGDEERVYNFIEKTFAEINHDKKTYKLLPLHAVPLANHKTRLATTQKAVNFAVRTGTGKMVKTLSGVALDTDSILLDLDTLYAGASTQKTSAQLTFKPETKTLETSGGRIAAFTLSTTSLTQGLQKTYQRFLVYGPVLHPVMEKAMGAPSRAFDSLEYANNNRLGTATAESWKLTGATEMPADAAPPAVPAGYTRRFSDNDDINQTFVVAQNPGPSIDHFAERIKSYVDKGDALRAVSAFYEMQLSLPTEENRDKIDDISMQMLTITNDNFVRQVMKVLGQKQTTKSGIEFANKTLMEAKQAFKEEDGTNYVYFYDVFRARNIRDMLKLAPTPGGIPDAREVEKAERMDLNAIFINPWLAAVYADLGTAEIEYGDALFAWACWEQAARLKPDLGTLDKMESQKLLAEKEFPEYF